MTNLRHNSFLYIYFNSLHVSSNLVLIIRRIKCISTTFGICHSASLTVSCDLHRKRSPTQSDIYQMLYWYIWFSWWWARGCSKHVEDWNKYVEKNCASSWSFTKNHWIPGLSRGKVAGACCWPNLHLAPRLKKGYSCTSTVPLGLHGVLLGELYSFV